MKPRVYSIGYKGLTPADLWHQLLGHGVEVVVDVRPRPPKARTWGSTTLGRGARYRGVQYLPLVSVSDLGRLAKTHRVALLSATPYHSESRRAGVAEAAGLLAHCINLRPRQIEMFSEVLAG